jgi:uncharacterized protein (DUF2141 family)
MFRVFFIFFVFTIISNCAIAQLKLEIEINGLRSDAGVVMLQLLDKNKEVIKQDKGTISDGRSFITFTDLKPGMYAVQYYHDENLSEKMETNILGIPEEGYGFSNNAYGLFGPKPYRERLFELKENKKITLKTKYH